MKALHQYLTAHSVITRSFRYFSFKNKILITLKVLAQWSKFSLVISRYRVHDLPFRFVEVKYNHIIIRMK